MIPLLGINERRGGNAEALQKGIRYFQVNFGSVGADAGHDVLLTVSYNPLSNYGCVCCGHKLLLNIAKAKLAELCGCVGTGELNCVSLTKLTDDMRGLQWSDKLAEDHEECAWADYPNLLYSAACCGSERNVFQTFGQVSGEQRRLCRERVGDVRWFGHNKNMLGARTQASSPLNR